MPGYAQQMARLINDQVDAGQVVTHKMGTVISRETATARAIVSFDGSSGIGQPVKCFETVVCDLGDRVGLIKFEGDWVIVGNYTLRTLGKAFASVQFSSSNNNTSATFIDMPSGASLTVLKVKDATQLRIKIGCSMFCTVANTTFSVGAHISNPDLSISTDLTLYGRAFNNATLHQDWTGGISTALTLPSNTYLITGRWLRRGGTGTLTMNTDDGAWIEVEEVVGT